MPVPASQFVNVVPSVLSAGGAQLALNGLMLTNSARVPMGTVLSFASSAAVATYSGAASNEAALANLYFAGFAGCSQFPSALLVAQCPTTAVQPFLRGGNAASLGLPGLQGINGTLVVTVNGVQKTSGNINLSGATSFSNAATTIQTAFNAFDASVTASIATQSANFSGSVTGNLLSVTAVASGTLAVGAQLGGTAGGGIPASCTILNQITGALGGTGTYTVSTLTNVGTGTGFSASWGALSVTAISSGTLSLGQSVSGTGISATGVLLTEQISGSVGGTGVYALSGGTIATMSSSAVTCGQLAVTYDSVSGGFVITGGTPGTAGTITQASGGLSASLFLTTATGAVLSQGAAGVSATVPLFGPQTITPAAFMPTMLAQTTNWASFFTTFNPDAFGNATKLAFAVWNNAQVNRYLYVCADTDITPTLSPSAPASLGALLAFSQISGTEMIYDPTVQGLQAFVSGMVGATNFSAIAGRITHAYKNQPGLTPTVTSQTVLTNLVANGYNMYVQAALAAQNLNFFWPGSVSGPFQWADSYVDQIWLNNALQASLLNLLTNINSIPYNSAGYAMIETSIAGIASQGLLNGVISPGVPLTANQIVEVNTAAGAKIDNILSTRGWYAQILPASGPVRQARTSPPMNFWYMDGGSVQQINLASIEAQ